MKEESTKASKEESTKVVPSKLLKNFKVSKGFAWILLSLLSGFCFGLQPLILGDISTIGFDVRALMNWGVFPICLFLFVYSFVQNDWSFGVENNSLFRKTKWSFGLILIIVVDTANTIMASWAVLLTFKYAILAETN